MANHNCNACFLNASIMDAFSNLRLSRELNSHAPEQCAQATLLHRELRKAHITRRVSSAWEYLLTFRLEDGRELALKAEEAQYAALTEGQQGRLTWQGEKLAAFPAAGDD